MTGRYREGERPSESKKERDRREEEKGGQRQATRVMKGEKTDCQ